MSQDYLNRRKVRGLTKLGRMVSEDPDIDNLLSNLSPEELEEVEKEVMMVPEPDPSEITIVDQTDSAKRGAKSDAAGSDSRKSLQRNVSVEDSKESRKQEYLRKMGWSQEKNDGLQRQDSSVSSPRDNKMEARRSSRGGLADRPHEEQTGAAASHRWRREESRDAEAKGDKTSDGKLNEKRDAKDSGSKTKEMMAKLQEKKDKEEARERERREEVRKRDEGKTKGLVFKMQEKREKEEAQEKERREEESRKREERKSRGLVSKMAEKQNQNQNQNEVDKADEKKKTEPKDKADAQAKGTRDQGGEKAEEKKGGQGKEEKSKVTENEVKASEDVKENASGEGVEENACPNDGAKPDGAKPDEKNAAETSEPAAQQKEAVGNCVTTDKKVPKKSKEEEEEEESASMFDEDLQKVRSNDPNMTELNVNNSEVIKTKTLMQFAEALRDNTHIKTFALANCRADDHVAYAIAATLRANKTLTSINLDSNLLTSKGIMSLIQALQHNATLTELRFHNQRHICGGKSEMEMTKILKDNTTLLKLGYGFELAGPRMTMTNILSRNMDRQRQRRLQEQKLAQANGDQKGALEVPKGKGHGFRSPKASPKPSPQPSPMASPKMAVRKGRASLGPPPPPGPGGPPPPPPPPPPAPMLDGDFLKNALTPVSRRKTEDRTGGRGDGKNSRDQLLASIRGNNMKKLKKVAVPKLLQ